MSDEMAVGDNATSDESKVNSEDVGAENFDAAGEASPKPSDEPPTVSDDPNLADEEPPELEDCNEEENPEADETTASKDHLAVEETTKEKSDEETRGLKRRASVAFSDGGDEEFKGFDEEKPEDVCREYSRILERLESEVQTAIKDFKPVRTLKAPFSSVNAGKRPRQDTDGSRPSSALSTRSDGEWSEAGASPGIRGRRSTTEMSSPLLRAPLERGWKRELVFRAALDAHSRRNADIYYYTPQGKKLRSTREVAEHLAGTGLTLENFSFFKEPLGVDDPEKEIIRDAKLMRRVESPVPAPPPPTEGKRTPKPKAPKGASPEPPTPKSPPSKLKVKSMGSRLSNNGTPPTAVAPKQTRRPQGSTPAPTPAPAPATPDNNNSATWKKPRAAGATQPPPPQPPPAPQPPQPQQPPPAPQPAQPPAAPQPPQPPPPLQSRPQQVRTESETKSSGQVVQPCSMSCGRGAVPSLACTACLCLYHPACAGLHSQPHHHSNFLCKNCRKSTSPPLEPPPLTHKSGATANASSVTVAAAGTRRPTATIPTPLPVPAKVRPDKRVLLRMKVAGGGADGSRVWAVAAPPAASGAGSGPTSGAISRTPPPGVRPTLPQSLAVLNGRRFIVVPRSLVHSDPH